MCSLYTHVSFNKLAIYIFFFISGNESTSSFRAVNNSSPLSNTGFSEHEIDPLERKLRKQKWPKHNIIQTTYLNTNRV